MINVIKTDIDGVLVIEPKYLVMLVVISLSFSPKGL